METRDPESPGETGSCLLVVDDLEQNRFLLEEALEGLTAEIVSAADGQRALDLFESRRPEVVVLDVQMPGMDGVEAARRIKEHADFTYVVLLSGYHEADAAEGIRRSRADLFLRKPYTLEEVRAAVSEGLEIVRRKRSGS